jgi:5-methylcytosine-specific restriction endonuclease McrA
VSRKISEEIRAKVRQRAKFLCEYCHANEHWQYVRFTIDHVAPNEDDSIENLALACFHCNRLKSNKTEIPDTENNAHRFAF